VIDTRTWLETPEHVAVAVELAGPASRLAAWLVDAAARGVVLFALAIPLGGLGGVGTGALLAGLFLLEWGWFTVWEALLHGQTPGKMAMGLRVVREDGGPVGWREAFIRNLLRAADVLPFSYGIGAVAMVADPRFRRIGDIVAGTVVIRVRAPVATPVTVEWAPLTPAEVAMLPPGLRVGRDEAAAVEGWADAGQTRGPAWCEATADRVAAGIRRRIRVPGGPVRALEVLGLLARAREPEELAALNGRRAAWDALERRLVEVQVGGVWPSQASQLAAEFRSVCGDLGRVRQRAPALRERLEPLAQALHDRIHAVPARRAAAPLRQVLAFLLVDVPAEIRRSGRALAVASALFYGSAVYGAWLVTSGSEAGERLLAEGERTELRAAYGARTPRGTEMDAQMAGFYVLHNAGIALRGAAAGTLAGLGTVWVLVYNGLAIGAVAGFLVADGLGENFLWFVSGHSPWELTAITLAGAAGLRLGTTVLVPGRKGRGAALRAIGPSLARLACGAAAMLVVAAAIEGFWSTLGFPVWAKVVFGAAQVLLVVAWIAGRRR
jgi:uncharacterized RDD family membrane protein YckC/uncharacterized membrane protein SpoIIM required for sporulation